MQTHQTYRSAAAEGPYYAHVMHQAFGVMRIGRNRPVVEGVSLRQAQSLALELNAAWAEPPDRLE